jgi:L-aminopeptidase/D-esterase-like protein
MDMADKYQDSIVAVHGIEVGHAQNDAALTGCTVILCRKGAVAGVDVRGSAPGTRETDLLDPINLVQKVHAVVLAGGSAFGLDSAGGVMRYLEEHRIGFNTGVAKIPIVPAVILYDLNLGDKNVRPDAEMGYKACLDASTNQVVEGNVGAGSGASVGKLFGGALSMKSGVGSASIDLGNGIVVGAIVAVNAWGDVIEDGKIIAGLRSGRLGPVRVGGGEYFADTLKMMRTLAGRNMMRLATSTNTAIGVVATNAALTKVEATKVAQMAHDGLARVIRPAHTMLDGDTIFALSTGSKKSDVTTIGSFAAEAMARAIIRAVKMSAPSGGLPGLKT